MTRLALEPAEATRALGALAHADDSDTASVSRYATAVWSHLSEPGDSVAGRLIENLGAAGALTAAIAGEHSAAISARELVDGRKRWLPRLAPDDIAASLRAAARADVALVTPADPQWPRQLQDLGAHAPHCLWVRGDLALLRRQRASVALVGARASTSYGEHVAVELSADLAGSGIPIVSGGAYGIDGAAHRAALKVGGTTVALLAGGAERAYPAGHAGLINDIAAKGVVASEVPVGSAPTKWRFLQRNRLIAALTDATVVVEAGWRSGSLNTAGHACALARPLGAVPGPITSAASAGTHRLLREYGAECITSGDDVRGLIGIDEARSDGRDPALGGDEPGHTDDTTRVRDALSTRSSREVTDIARRAGMSTEQTAAILGVLQLEDAVVRTPQGWRASPRER